MSTFPDVDFVDLAANPPEVDLSQIGNIPSSHMIHGPLSSTGTEDEDILSPIIESFQSIGLPFILWTFDDNGDDVSAIWDGPECEIVWENGHISRTVEAEKINFITCKWYTPSENDANETKGLGVEDDYPYNRLFPHIRHCTNPKMGAACGVYSAQPACDGYAPSEVTTPVFIRSKDGQKDVIIRSTRINEAILAKQVIAHDGDDVVYRVILGDDEEYTTINNELRTHSSNLFGEYEEVEVVGVRQSFIKGIITT